MMDDVDPAKDNEDKNTDPTPPPTHRIKQHCGGVSKLPMTNFGPRKTAAEGYFIKKMLARTPSSIWAVVVLLITRIEEIGLKEQPKKTELQLLPFTGSYVEPFGVMSLVLYP
jgi:hypothetical protein